MHDRNMQIVRRGHAPAFLASVTNVNEARLAIASGADIIDCKNPARGALGALSAAVIRDVVAAVDRTVAVSATIGDLPAEAGVIVPAAEAIASTGVDVVKAGFFGDGDPRAAIAALGQANLGAACLVAVLMADRSPDFDVLADLERAGFVGVMLDTADKASGALPDVLDARLLETFIALAHRHGLIAGLAGSLQRQHIDGLVALGPDIIGFRGALCGGGRTEPLDAARVALVRRDISAAARLIERADNRLATPVG